jgi:hypothetical protein
LVSRDARLSEQTREHLLDNAMQYRAPGELIDITVRRGAARGAHPGA